MKNLYEKLKIDLETLLQVVDDEENVLAKLEHCIVSAKSILDQLRTYVLETGLKNREEEILFFKEVKPEFYSIFIYYISLYKWELKKPPGKRSVLIDYYRKERDILDAFIRSNEDLYSYYRSGSDYMDAYYFVRSGFNPKNLLDDREYDYLFSTANDYQIAKLKAAEKLIIYLDDLMFDNSVPEITPMSDQGIFAWTGEGINLIELAYGLWLTGQINHGNASVSLIVRKLEAFFGIHLGRAARRWEEIAARKKDSPTRFLDQMTFMVKQRLDDQLKL